MCRLTLVFAVPPPHLVGAVGTTTVTSSCRSDRSTQCPSSVFNVVNTKPNDAAAVFSNQEQQLIQAAATAVDALPTASSCQHSVDDAEVAAILQPQSDRPSQVLNNTCY